MENLKKEGIDLLKKLSNTIIETVIEIKKDSSDNGFQFFEIIALGDNAISLIKHGLNWEKLLAQIKDLDSEEAQELTDYIISRGVMSSKAKDVLRHTVSIAYKLLDIWFTDLSVIIEAIGKKEISNE